MVVMPVSLETETTFVEKAVSPEIGVAIGAGSEAALAEPILAIKNANSIMQEVPSTRYFFMWPLYRIVVCEWVILTRDFTKGN